MIAESEWSESEDVGFESVEPHAGSEQSYDVSDIDMEYDALLINSKRLI